MRHKPETIEKARNLSAQGLTVPQIRKVLGREGVTASWTAVRRWVDAEFREHENRKQAHRKGKCRDRRGEYLKRRARELHARGVGTDAISVVLDIYHGRQISGRSLRLMLQTEAQEASK